MAAVSLNTFVGEELPREPSGAGRRFRKSVRLSEYLFFRVSGQPSLPGSELGGGGREAWGHLTRVLLPGQRAGFLLPSLPVSTSYSLSDEEVLPGTVTPLSTCWAGEVQSSW